MLDTEQMLALAQDLLAAARREGADAADVVLGQSASTRVAVRGGALEDVSRDEGESLTLRAFFGQRVASSATPDFSKAALDALAARVVAMA
ncbi:MAG: TldD/PmbA family protein, partial [Alphaproteobacteria bacterium]|nr:TldD/PmbA family protein [Alphaproteobacteria bacterium]